MSTISVNLPDDVLARVERRAAVAGRADVAEYIRALVEEDAGGEEYAGPDHLLADTPERADALIREGLASPVREMTAGDWATVRRRVEEGIAAARGGAT